MDLDRVAQLLGAASTAPDRATRAMYLAEARVLLLRATERGRELLLLLTAQEAELARAVQLPLGGDEP